MLTEMAYNITYPEYLEITTAVGCPCNCLKYCAQEVFVKAYKQKRNPELMLSISNYKKALTSVPKYVTIVFSGFCEPFQNPSVVDMALFAFQQGYKVRFYTTLFNATTDDVRRLSKIDFDFFMLHVPDGANFKKPSGIDYDEVFFLAIELIRKTQLMTMNDNFSSNNREVVARQMSSGRHIINDKGPCMISDKPKMLMLPNGDLQLCCYDMALEHTIGNLFQEKYLDVASRLKNDFALCKYCCIRQSFSTYNRLKIRKSLRKLIPQFLF